ncbi:MAG TPA: lipid A deacylase LpxR family protein [Gemmatimonadales bacterium]|jgi:hypothetical protein
MLPRTVEIALLLLMTGAAPLLGQRHSAWSLTVDNDLFAIWRSTSARTDRDYSSGVELSLARPLSPAVRWTRTLVLTLDHQLFTPDIREPRPVPEDRPFAAVLSAGATLQFEQPDRRHSFGVGLAVTGPPALGDELQELVHDLLNSPVAHGWEQQLPFEVGVSVAYAGDRRLIEAGSEDGVGVRTAARWGGELGTIRSAATIGLGTVAGWRPPRAWRPPAPEPSERSGLRVFIPLGVGLDIVGQSIVLDGGVIAKSTGLDRETLVPYAEFGLGVEIGAVAVSWTGHVTGREFETQPGAHRYGTFKLSIR